MVGKCGGTVGCGAARSPRGRGMMVRMIQGSLEQFGSKDAAEQ